MSLTDLKELKWSNEEVLLSNFDRNLRKKNLDHAIMLGQFYRKEVGIIFGDKENGTYKLFAKIKSIKEGKLHLGREAFIPIHKVIKIVFVTKKR